MGDFTIMGLPVSLGTMIYQAALFTILVLLLKKLVFKKLVAILDSRKEKIENQLQLTEQFKQDAEKNYEISEDVLKEAKNNAREIRRHSENEAKLIIQAAKEEAKQILKQAKEEAFSSHALSFSQNDKIKGA